MNEETKVLVIDDDEVDRLTLRRALKKSEIDYSLTECVEATSAIELLKKSQFDCIFLDYLLPGTDGLVLLKRLRTEGIKTPVIIVTSQGDEKIAVEMMKSGASDYIVKTQIDPLNIKKIVQNATRLGQIERQREEAEKALLISQARLSEAQKIARIGNWDYNFITNEIYWSEEVYRIFELDPETFVPTAKNYVRLFHEDDRPAIKHALKTCADNGMQLALDLRVVLPDGTFKFVNVHAYYQYRESGEIEKFVGTVQDINQRKMVEQELIEAKKIAEESGKIKEQFLANMSHEIRTPMNAIIGFTNLLTEQKNLITPEHFKYIKAIHDAGEHLMVIINDILDFSKIESGKMVIENLDFSLPELIEKAVSLFRPKAEEKGIQLAYTIKEDVPVFVTGDPVRLNQVLVNLISNALKFTEVGYVKLDVEALRQSSSRAMIRFSIEDTGIGIPENKLTTVFESFTQARSDTTRKYGGTGLGLTIVKKIVELQRGEVSVHSVEGQGSTFIIDLPFEKSVSDNLKQKLEGVNKEEVKADYPKNIRVLMAEDNELNQALSESIFKRIGWHLDIAGNGAVALEKLKSSNYDIVLMDIQMPEMDGHTATLKIRNEFEAPLSQIPIIAITAHALNSEVKKCLAAGMNDYISKPFKVEDLIRKVCALVKKEVTTGKIVLEDQKPAVTDDSNLINLNSLYEMSGNSPETVKTIINMFLSQAPGRVQELLKHLEKQDWENIKKLAHKMKSSYAILGMTRLKEYMQTMEDDCMNNTIDISKFEAIMTSVQSLNEKLMKELENVLSMRRSA